MYSSSQVPSSLKTAAAKKSKFLQFLSNYLFYMYHMILFQPCNICCNATIYLTLSYLCLCSRTRQPFHTGKMTLGSPRHGRTAGMVTTMSSSTWEVFSWQLDLVTILYFNSTVYIWFQSMLSIEAVPNCFTIQSVFKQPPPTNCVQSSTIRSRKIFQSVMWLICWFESCAFFLLLLFCAK